MIGHQGARKVAVTVGCAIGLLAMVDAPVAAADDRTVVPLAGVFKRCDFTSNTFTSARGNGRALARIGPAGRQSVVADVELFTGVPSTRYTARLIQTPRPSLTCSLGDPGVTVAALNTDGAGAGMVTLQAPQLAGTTGAWVFLDRPGEYSQTPTEFYTSDFIATV